MRKKQGAIIANGVILEKHELQTVVFLTGLGFNIELIPLSNTKGVKTADIKLNNLEWEIKCPHGNSRMTVERAFHVGLHQSENLIFDLRHIGAPHRNLNRLKKLFQSSKRIKKLLIIMPNKHQPELIDITQLL